ncbi:TetR/AcrR family transcriptional regulator [Streptomyces sp. NPDC026092]|uniref:TetR/AcrR family transcriptional regulator n=1 Tax=Streptomyces sp. NPDC026092 TaxID=3154797 RepID=UPI0033C72F6A
MERHPEHTRQVLISATAGLIADGPFTDVGLVNICRAAGVSRGALYHHFASIAELVARVYDQARARVDELFDESYRKSKSASEAPAEFSIALCAALLDEDLVRAGVRIGPDGTNAPPRLREQALAKVREQIVANGPADHEEAEDIHGVADLAMVITAGLESLGHTDAYWWQPETTRRIWDMVSRPDAA